MILGPWIRALQGENTLLVDELDTKLHHLLIVFLINLFNDPIQNKNKAQLIFTTHNTDLLDQEIFRRDQIWFTEKNPETSSTELFSNEPKIFISKLLRSPVLIGLVNSTTA